jgi:Domain of unknown function (DUF6602)
MPKNQVRDIFIARIQQLLAQYEGSKSITHPTTVGTMREEYLRGFLRALLPPKFHPVTGFICDMYGNITPQLDMIFIDHSELPTVSLVNDTVIVPYEIALLTAEVKSTIKMETLEQIKKQREAINEMQSQFLMGTSSPNTLQTRKRPQTIGTFIMAFESDVSEDNLKKWVTTEMGSPAGICVVNPNDRMLALFEQVIAPSGQIEQQISTGPGDYDPLLTFVGMMYRSLYYLFLANSTMSDDEQKRFWATHAMWIWESYLSIYQHEYVKKACLSPPQAPPVCAPSTARTG